MTLSRTMCTAGSGVLAAMLIVSLGCATYPTRHGRGVEVPNPELLYPVVAVADFENRSNFRGQWELGDGMAELLVNQLLLTGEVVVLERKHLDDVLVEIELQRDQAFRTEGRASPGRLKNVEYILRGTITDFTVTGDVSGWFGTSKGRAKAGHAKARVSLAIKVADIETGEITGAVEASGEAGSGWFGGDVEYSDVNFGGEAFFRTPLGEATNKAIRKAVNRILESLPDKRWQPRVAALVDGEVVINGGVNVGLEVGVRFLVRGPVRDITDPVTGNVIERVPGPVLGRLEVVRVIEQAAYARLLDGEADRGLPLERISEPQR